MNDFGPFVTNIDADLRLRRQRDMILDLERQVVALKREVSELRAAASDRFRQIEMAVWGGDTRG